MIDVAREKSRYLQAFIRNIIFNVDCYGNYKINCYKIIENNIFV